jgi:hypothetical protein
MYSFAQDSQLWSNIIFSTCIMVIHSGISLVTNMATLPLQNMASSKIACTSQLRNAFQKLYNSGLLSHSLNLMTLRG